jgi:predicted transcriptional regulator
VLSRRERELMDILYRLGEATVGVVRDEMTAPPSYSAVRAALNTLESKGHARVRREGRAHVYRPARPVQEVRTSALKRVVSAFFGGSAAKTAVALVELEGLDSDELAELKAAIARAEQEGR